MGPQCFFLYEMQVRSSQCHALAEDISPNKVLRKEDMKHKEEERKWRKHGTKREPALWDTDRQTRTCEEAELRQKEKEPTGKEEDRKKEFGFNPVRAFFVL